MFKKTELELWWEQLDPRSKEYLKKQPLWYDKDLYKALAVGIAVGLLVGLIVGFELGYTPNIQQPTYLKG